MAQLKSLNRRLFSARRTALDAPEWERSGRTQIRDKKRVPIDTGAGSKNGSIEKEEEKNKQERRA